MPGDWAGFRSLKKSSWVVPAVVLTDQVSKLWVTSTLHPFQTLPIVPHFMNFILSRNTGMAFGLLNGLDFEYKTLLVTLLSVLALVAVAYFMLNSHRQDRLVHFGLVLVLGGAVGNILDRVRLGYVVDFIDVYVRNYHWHTFNVADSAISVGVGLILLQSLRSPGDAGEAGARAERERVDPS